MASILTHLGFHKRPVPLTDLRFPVLLIPPDQPHVFVARDIQSITHVIMGASNTPRHGTTVIDADFKMYKEENVKCDQGEFGMLLRAFVSPRKPLTFQISLLPLPEHGLATILDRLVKHAYLGGNPDEIDRQRKLLAVQTTMQGIVEVLAPQFVGQAPP